MARPGPKPVDVSHLETEATQWACFFYTLRDGQPGYMQKVKYERATREQLQRMNWYRFMEQARKADPRWKSRPKGRPLFGRPFEPPIPIPVSEAARALPADVRTEDWFVAPPVMPKREVWRQIADRKEVSTVLRLQQAARHIGDLRAAFASSTKWAQNPDGAISQFAKKIVDAKQLPHYPNTDRPRSDDKRVVFLAKVMAGLTLGLEPITAVKRLSHWTWPKDWAERSLKEFEK